MTPKNMNYRKLLTYSIVLYNVFLFWVRIIYVTVEGFRLQRVAIPRALSAGQPMFDGDVLLKFAF